MVISYCNILKQRFKKLENTHKYDKIKKFLEILRKEILFTEFQYIFKIGAWLSLVERCVRDAEVASSNLVAPIFLRSFSLAFLPIILLLRHKGIYVPATTCISEQYPVIYSFINSSLPLRIGNLRKIN